MTGRGRSLSHAGAAVILLVVGLGLAVSLGQTLRPTSATHNSVVTTVGIDADTTGNTATSLGTIQSCRSVSNGATFTVDFYVTSVPSPGIEGFQASLSYNSARLKVTANNVSMLLAANPGSSVQDFTPDSLPDTDGTFTPIAFDFGTVPGHTETGSGVLARITLQAISSGVSQLNLSTVKLSDPKLPDPNPIGDINGDRIFDGDIANAQIYIGQQCPTPTATPTRTPTPTSTPTLGPTATPNPVGGFAELPALPGTEGAAHEKNGSPAPATAGLITAAIALTVVAGAALWLLRRRSVT